MTTRLLYCFYLLIMLSACAPTRSLTYFEDLTTNNYSEEIRNRSNPTIQPDDLLGISVNSLNPESNQLFNNGTLQTMGSFGNTASDAKNDRGYVVDRDGKINFPVLGSIRVSNLTKEQAMDLLTDALKKYVKNPIVNIKYLNFKITVIGEVNRPSTFTVPTEKVNIIEALGLAGDLTPYGKREQVLIIRETMGIRNATHINLTSKELFNSTYYYLQQNDIVYVPPTKARRLQSGSTTFYLSIISTVVAVLTIVLISGRR